MSDLLSDLAANFTLTTALHQVVGASSYDDYATLLLLGLGAVGYLSRGKLWDQPDPYHYKWFERPQEAFAGGKTAVEECRDIVQKLEETHSDLVIFWGSQSGTAERFAHSLARDCRQRFRLNALVADISDYDHTTTMLIPQSKFAVFIMSTYGEGDPSDNSADFLTWLQSSSAISFSSLRYAAFGLGNRNYKYFNRVIDNVVDALQNYRATSLLSVGRADDATGATAEDFLEWKERLFAMFQSVLGLEERIPEYEPALKVVEDESLSPIDLFLGEPVPSRTTKKSLTAPSPVVSLPIKTSHELLVNPTASRSVLHMDIDLGPAPEVKYKTGDHIAIWPVNPDQEVYRLLRVLELEARKDVPLMVTSNDPNNAGVKCPTPTTALALFQHYLEICAPVARETVLSLAQLAPSDESKTFLLNIGKDKASYTTFLHSNHVTLARLLEITNTSWATLPLSFVIEAVPLIQPRYYSVSSSSAVSPRVASLTAVVSSIPLRASPTTMIPGLATSYLSNLGPRPINTDLTYPSLTSNHLNVQIRQSTFKLPASSSTPLVLVGAGTGIAPLRAFILERARLQSVGRTSGPILLIYGCRNPQEDFLYRTELEGLAASSGVLHGILEVNTAFSRAQGQSKQYVQDRLDEPNIATRVSELLVEQGAGLYICGSASMGLGVAKKLEQTFRQRHGWDEKAWKSWAQGRKSAGRWKEDVWG